MILAVVDTAAYLSTALFILAVLDVLVIGEFLIERKGRYVPDVVRRLMVMVGVVAAGVVILRAVMNINLLRLLRLRWSGWR